MLSGVLQSRTTCPHSAGLTVQKNVTNNYFFGHHKGLLLSCFVSSWLKRIKKRKVE
jgi:hypothetical protein